MFDRLNSPAVRPSYFVRDSVSGDLSPVGGGSTSGVKQPVRLLSFGNIAGTYVGGTTQTFTVTATGRLAIDSVNASVGDRVALVGQSTATQNGIYVVTVQGTTGVQPVLTRAQDCNSSGEFAPAFFFGVSEGTVYADTYWGCTVVAPFVLDTNNATFAQAPLSVVYGAAGDMAAAGLAVANAGGASSKLARTDHKHAYPPADRSAAEQISAAGALSVALRSSILNVSGTKAYTLANGTYVGQRKTVFCRAAASTPVGTLTPASPNNFATATFSTANGGIELEWNGTGWDLVAVSGTVTIA